MTWCARSVTWKLSGAAAQPSPELALAVRLDAPRAGLWTSNLVAALGSLTNVQSLPSPANGLAWRFHTQVAADVSRHQLASGKNAPTDVGGYTLSVIRAGDWTLVGLALERNTRLDDFAARIQRDQTPVSTPSEFISETNPTNPPIHQPTRSIPLARSRP